ncbi:MAG TPA: hypothetical protein VIK61_12250 [Acidimicrobiia bacterium]
MKATGTIADGDLVADNADGSGATWNGSATKRIIGQAIAASSGGFVDVDLDHSYFTP